MFASLCPAAATASRCDPGGRSGQLLGTQPTLVLRALDFDAGMASGLLSTGGFLQSLGAS
jgi:hypothetical protein